MSPTLEWFDEYRASFSYDLSRNEAVLRLEPVKTSNKPVEQVTVDVLDRLLTSEGGEPGYAQNLYDETYRIGEWGKQNPTPDDRPSWTPSEGEIPGPYRPNFVISPIMTLDPRVVPEGGYSPANPAVAGVPGPANDEGIWLVFSAVVGVSALYVGYRWRGLVKAVTGRETIKLIIKRFGFPGAVAGGLAGWAIDKKIRELTGTAPAENSGHRGGGSSEPSSPTQPTDQSQDTPGSEYGQPDRPDHTESSSEPTSGESDTAIEVTVDNVWYDRRTGEHGTVDDKTPNPEDPDGGGEGPEGNWWEGLPWLNPFVAVDDNPIGTDEGGESVFLKPGRAGLGSQLTAFLLPRPVGTDEGSEGLIIRIDQVRTSGNESSGTSTDDWGDKPRSLAESYVAMRIRVGAFSPK